MNNIILSPINHRATSSTCGKTVDRNSTQRNGVKFLNRLISFLISSCKYKLIVMITTNKFISGLNENSDTESAEQSKENYK